MFNSNSGYSLADIAAATGGTDRNNGGMWNDGGAWWIIILFLFCFAGWGNGFGGFGGFGSNGSGFGSPSGQGWATRADINEGFALQNLQNGVTAIHQGICDSTYALNNSITNGFHGVDSAICQLGYQTQQGFNNTNVALMQGQNALATQLANCCCDTRSAIQQALIISQIKTLFLARLQIVAARQAVRLKEALLTLTIIQQQMLMLFKLLCLIILVILLTVKTLELVQFLIISARRKSMTCRMRIRLFVQRLLSRLRTPLLQPIKKLRLLRSFVDQAVIVQFPHMQSQIPTVAIA